MDSQPSSSQNSKEPLNVGESKIATEHQHSQPAAANINCQKTKNRRRVVEIWNAIRKNPFTLKASPKPAPTYNDLKAANHRPSSSNDEASKIEKLPAEIFNKVVDGLDIVSLVCLRYTNNKLHSLIPKPNLSPCAKGQVIRHLNRDSNSFLKIFLPARKAQCPGYTGPALSFLGAYCDNCRCKGHMEYCQECGVRTCLRRNVVQWQNWTVSGNSNTAQHDAKAPAPSQ